MSKKPETVISAEVGVVSNTDPTELSDLQLCMKIAHLGHYATFLEPPVRRSIALAEQQRYEAELEARSVEPVPSYEQSI